MIITTATIMSDAQSPDAAALYRLMAWLSPAFPVGEPGQWEAEYHVKKRERGAGQERDPRIGQMQLQSDRFQDRGDRVAVGNAERIDRHHHEQHVPARHE